MSMNGKSLPRLLCDLWQKKATGALKLNKRLVEKIVYLRQGKLVHGESNLLQDALGNYLVKHAGLDAAEAAATLETAQTTGKRYGEILIEGKLIDPTDLYKRMQQLLTAKVVDCLLWEDGNYQFTPDTAPPEGYLDLNVDPFHVLVQGVQTTMPFERMRADISLVLNKPVRVVQTQLPAWSEGYLNTTSLKLLKAFHEPKKPRFVMEELNISEETMLRIVYIFDVTGLIVNTETPLSAAVPQIKPPAQPPAPVADTTEDPTHRALVDEVIALTLKLDKTNHFELLGLDFDATPVSMSMAYLKFIERFSLSQFRSGKLAEYRQQAENILLAAAEAYADLRDNDSKVRYTDKVKAKRRAEENAGKKNPGAAFKIRTDLLDAGSQFDQGVKHLEQRRYDKAIEYFEYAVDIDGREPRYDAYLAWSKYQQREAVDDAEIGALFEKAIKEGSDDAKINLLYGKYLMDREPTKKKGLHHLKRASTLAPADLEIQRAYRIATSEPS